MHVLAVGEFVDHGVLLGFIVLFFVVCVWGRMTCDSRRSFHLETLNGDLDCRNGGLEDQNADLDRLNGGLEA